MSGSKLNPNTYNGEERSGGYLKRNHKPASARAPHWKGKCWLIGYGWVWVSGWDNREDMIRLSLQDMSDEQARKFCQPRGDAQNQPNAPKEQRPNGQDTVQSDPNDIPF